MLVKSLPVFWGVLILVEFSMSINYGVLLHVALCFVLLPVHAATELLSSSSFSIIKLSVERVLPSANSAPHIATKMWCGTGFFINTPAGLRIATAAHVVQSAKAIHGSIAGTNIALTVTAIDDKTDLALLAFLPEAQGLSELLLNQRLVIPLTLAQNIALIQPSKQELLVSCGYPAEWDKRGSLHVASGHCSCLYGSAETVDAAGTVRIYHGTLLSIQGNKTMLPGMSGGPLINQAGHVIAVMVFYYNADDACAISVMHLKNLISKESTIVGDNNVIA